jgi:hypothetical protein
MRIVRRPEFLGLPAGTIYCAARSAEDCDFGVMHVKADTLDYNDFVCLALNGIEAHDSDELMARMDAMLEAGASYPLEESFGRDGCFHDNEIYLIYERADLERIIDYCRQAAD